MNNEELKAVVEGQGKGYTATEILDTLDALYAGKIKALEDSERLALDQMTQVQLERNKTVGELSIHIAELERVLVLFRDRLRAAGWIGSDVPMTSLAQFSSDDLNRIEEVLSGVVGSTRKDEQGTAVPVLNSHARITQLEAQLREREAQIKELKDTLDTLNSQGAIIGGMPCKVCGAAIAKLYAPGGWLCYQCRLKQCVTPEIIEHYKKEVENE